MTTRSSTTPARGVFEHPPSPLIEVPELHPENAERIRNIRARPRATARSPTGCAGATGRHAEPRRARDAARPGIRRRGRRVLPAGGGASRLSRPGCRPVMGGGARRGRHGARSDRPRCSTETASRVATRSCARRGTTRSRPRRTATACSRTPPLQPSGRAAAASRGSRSSTGTSTTATARRSASATGADVLAISLHMRHGSWGPSHPQTGAPGGGRRRRRRGPQRQRRAPLAPVTAPTWAHGRGWSSRSSTRSAPSWS